MRFLVRLSFVLLSIPMLFGACLCQGPCESDSDCPTEGDICATDGGTCRVALTCEDTGCATNQLCDDGDGADAACLQACNPGFDWDADARACIDSPEGCAMCAAENRACVAGDPATCSDCLAGFNEDATGSCVPEANCDPVPADGSILEACNAINRVCVDDPMGADCGVCALGFIEVNSICELEVACDQALIDSCADDNRECIEAPNGQCGVCLEGFIAETDANGEITNCRAPLTCSELNCAALCNPETTGMDAADAFCSDPCTGPSGNPGINNAAGTCVECGDCDDAANGEDGAYLMALFAGDRCICNSAAGFYFDPQLNDNEPCDADGDGWTRENAKLAADLGDSVVDATYGCTVRQINAIVLEREDGQTSSISLAAPADLYESNRNDNQIQLDVSGLLQYGSQPLAAEELNGLTKACVGTGQNADYNDNGTPDVDEFQGQPLATGESAIHTPFLDFAYFIELNRGYYEAPGTGVGPGTYRVREKSRSVSPPAGEGIALTIEDEGGADGGVVNNDYWRTCQRYVSDDLAVAQASGLDVTTLDFAQYGENGGFVMGHHSQFRCLRVVSQTGGGDPPHWVTQTNLITQSTATDVNRIYETLTTCEKLGTNGPLGDSTNPSDADLGCISGVSADSLSNGDVVWAISGFKPYVDITDEDGIWANGDRYTRGCIDECAELRNTCPGFSQDAIFNTACGGSAQNFGRLACGCAPNLGGPDCSFACPGQDPNSAGYDPTQGGNLFLSSDYEIAPRQGIWLCGQPSASDGTVLTEAADGGVETGWTLYGEVPAVVTPLETLCEGPDAGTDGGVICNISISGYSLSGSGRVSQ